MDQSRAIGELFQLLWQMRKTMHSCMRQLEHCCPNGQFFMLERLHYAVVQRGKGEAIPVSALAEQTRVLPAAVSRSLRQLESAGLAERIPDPKDHRRALVRLTPAGEEIRLRSEALLRDYMNRAIGRMGEDNFCAMLEAWRSWDDAMRAELPESTAASAEESSGCGL